MNFLKERGGEIKGEGGGAPLYISSDFPITVMKQ